MKYCKWTEEEIKYLQDNWGKVKIEDIDLNRSQNSIYAKVSKMNLGPNYSCNKRVWTEEELLYLQDNWGLNSMGTIAKNLNRSVIAVQVKAVKLGLGSFLESGEYITLNRLMVEMRGYRGISYTINQWKDKGLPIRTKRVKNHSFKVIYLEDFWKWAEKNRTIIDFSNLEPLVFGKEPDWMEEQRKADKEKSYFKKTPWTETEDRQLKIMLEQYRYTYRELSLKLKRTEGAIKRRVCDLNIKSRPIKMSNHNPWSEKETGKLIELYHKGHTPNTIANYIPRSAQSCSGKIERLIKEDVIQPRSEFRKSC